MERAAVRVVFKINYYTHWGEAVAVVGDIPELGHWSPQGSSVKCVYILWVNNINNALE